MDLATQRHFKEESTVLNVMHWKMRLLLIPVKLNMSHFYSVQIMDSKDFVCTLAKRVTRWMVHHVATAVAMSNCFLAMVFPLGVGSMCKVHCPEVVVVAAPSGQVVQKECTVSSSKISAPIRVVRPKVRIVYHVSSTEVFNSQ